MKFSTTDLFVSYSIGCGSDIDIFTSMEDAEKESKKSNEYYHTLILSEKNVNPYVAMTLYDAIELEKDYIREETEAFVRNNIG